MVQTWLVSIVEEKKQYTFYEATYFIAKVFMALAEMLKMLGQGLLKYFFKNSREEKVKVGADIDGYTTHSTPPGWASIYTVVLVPC